MKLRRDDVIVGVDTHKDEHVAILLDGLGGRLAELFIPATAAGFIVLLELCRDHVGPEGRLVAFGVEGTGSYGIGLARFLRRHGLTVHEVHRPPRRGERRLSGKSDTIDAEHAARQVLTGRRAPVPKTAAGAVEALRLIKIAGDTAVKARTSAIITLRNACTATSPTSRPRSTSTRSTLPTSPTSPRPESQREGLHQTQGGSLLLATPVCVGEAQQLRDTDAKLRPPAGASWSSPGR